MIANIKELLSFASEILKEVLEAWFAVLTRPREFIAALDLDSNKTLIKASVFGVFVSLVNVAINVPELRARGVQVDSPTYLLADTVLTYLLFFLSGVLYHLAAKIVQGHGTIRGSVIGYFYLSALTPIGAVLVIPAVRRVGVFMHQLETDPISFVRALGEVTRAEPTSFLFLGLFYFAYITFLLVWSARIFGVVHRVGRLRAGVLSVIGFLLYVLAGTLFFAPAELQLRRAFGS